MLILDWTDEERFPDLTNGDRILGILYGAGIADLDTLIALSGWKKGRVARGIQDARQRANRKVGPTLPPEEKEEEVREERRRNREERDKWILIQKKGRHGRSFYSLGPKGFAYVCEMLGESVGKRKPPKAQVDHFLGTNQILVRLLKAGVRPVWYSTREATSWLFHNVKSRTIHYDSVNDRYVVSSKRSPYALNPDAMVQLPDGRSYILEYETGSTHGAKAEGKFLGYLDLQLGANVKLPPVVFVTRKDNVSKLERAKRKAMSREEYQGLPIQTDFFILEEGTETKFLLDRETAEPVKEASSSFPPPSPTSTPVETEEVESWKQEVRKMQEELEKQRADMDYWVEKSSRLERLAKEQAEWMETLDRWMSSKMLARGAYEEFLKRHPKPKEGLE